MGYDLREAFWVSRPRLGYRLDRFPLVAAGLDLRNRTFRSSLGDRSPHWNVDSSGATTGLTPEDCRSVRTSLEVNLASLSR
jgi:hypothetical protein